MCNHDLNKQLGKRVHYAYVVCYSQFLCYFVYLNTWVYSYMQNIQTELFSIYPTLYNRFWLTFNGI